MTPVFVNDQSWNIVLTFCTFHGLGPLACSNSELIFEAVNSFRLFSRNPWTGELLVASALHIQRTTQKSVDRHPWLKRDSNPWFQCLSSPRPRALDCMATGIGSLLNYPLKNENLVAFMAEVE